MKVIWLILLTMVLFNGFLVTFSSFFPKAPPIQSNDVSNSNNLSAFKTPGQMNIGTLINDVVTGAAVIPFIVGSVITLATKNFQYLAAGGMISLVYSIWVATSAVFGGLFANYTILLGVYSLVSMIIGIIFAIQILGIFTGQDQLSW